MDLLNLNLLLHHQLIEQLSSYELSQQHHISHFFQLQEFPSACSQMSLKSSHNQPTNQYSETLPSIRICNRKTKNRRITKTLFH